ncbi:fatty acid synthase-like [Pseudomyrmex gracilis]|uniref:fatty acid synthase-like n=1 Tax=Pseudomyrmex gracilis TaxID=219809 RepID=UPI000995B90C|nr:fatty acid synthase-like [Pseudomyrmex gracilis]
MELPIIVKTIHKCDEALKPYGICVTDILLNKKEITCNDSIKLFMAIISIQIAMVDLLLHIGIVPDYVLGQSIGELLCGYVDELFTLKETIVMAYYMSVAFEKLKVEHCNYISAASNQYSESTRLKLQEYLNQIVPYKSMKSYKYSKKWLNTLLPHSKIYNSFTQLSAAEYYAYSAVYSSLEELLPIIPENVVVIEIVSYNNWQFFMKKVLDSNYISLFQHGQGNNIDSILKGIGNLYNIGCQPQVANLYPPIQFPVSRGTPMISPLIKWDHSENCYVATFISEKKPNIRETIEEITFKDSSLKYMYDHVIDRRILLPASGYLFLIWKMIGTLSCCDYKNIPIIFEDVNFLRATHLSKTTTVKLTLSIQNGSNQFEISEETTVVVTGKVWIPNDIANHKVLIHNLNEPKHNVTEYMNTKDIYKELRLRGYHYSGIFQGLKSASISTKVGHIRWSDNWTAFIDNMLQMKILLLDSRNLFVPTRIRKLVIDPEFHMKQIQTTPDERANFPVRVYDSLDVIISGGIEIYGVMATNIPRQNTESIHDEYCFIAHCDRAVMSLTEIIQMSAHISLECNPVLHANFIELIEDVDTVTEQDLLSTICYDILNNLPLIEPNITLVATANRFKTNELSPNINLSGNLTKDKNVLMIIVFKLLTKNRSELIDTLLSTLKEGSFVLSRENLTESYNYTLLQQYKLNIVLEKRTEKEAFVLLRKTQSIVPQEVIYINNSDFSWINKLKSSLNMDDKLNASTRTILVADDFECGILGFINCLRKELNKTDDKIRCVFIQDENAPKFSLQDSVYINQLQLDLPINILRPNKVWGSYRHLPLPQLEPKFVQHGYVVQSVRGDLSKLRWIEGPIFPDYKQENLVRVVYASLNFKDIMIATGRIPLDISGKKAREIDSFLGCEFVGFNAAGKRIMGISTLRGITNLIVADPQLCWIIPDKWTLEDAATVPVAYCTSCYALYTCGKLKKGEKILIHSGTGAVGQSAIYLALFEGCEIFTTVGTPEKRNFIREKFPSIPEDHIGNSRDTSFEQMISQKTRGRGVDIVLNSLAEDKLQASIRCLARGGRFLEIGKYDLISNSTINLKEFSKGISFYGVLLDRVFISTDERRKIHIHNLLNNMIQRGAVEPLKREVFEQHEVETAFKHMAAAKHIGKVIIKIRTEEEVVDAPILAYPQYFCNEHKSYIILGGLGGFGLELTDWLILRGARKIILISRNGIKNGYQQSRVELWKSYGVNVQIMTGIDASTHEDCASILRFANKLGPVDAIFNLAVVLNDNIFTNQTPETFEESFQSKARATKQLDHLSRKMCPHLRHFVVFSSVSCGKGNPGQTNYGMANSIMERICEKRVQDGLPGMAIQWGAIGDVGLVADMQQNNKELVISGTLQQRISSCLESLNTFLMQNRPIVSSMIVATKSKVSGDIAHIVMNIMGLKTLKGVGEHVLLSELGMDSMMGLEIKQTIEREFSIFFTIQELRNLTFAKLKEIANKDTYDKQNAEKQLDTNNSQHIKIFNLFQLISDLDIFSDICIELSTQREISRNQVFLLPGIEGFANVYNSIAPKIKAPAICLQHSSINIPESAHSVIQSATDLLPHILSKLTDSTEFVIGAYSYGSLIAIEIVKQLEAKNFRGRLILIDGAPKYLQIVQETLFPFTNSQEFQILVLKQMTDVFNIPVSELNISEISKYVTWEEKLNIFIKNLKSEITNTISSDSIKIFCTTIYKHLIAVQEYDTSSLISIRSPIILLKATNPLLPSVEEDYGLNKISKNVQIHYVDSNHISIINTEQVAAAINGVIREEQ